MAIAWSARRYRGRRRDKAATGSCGGVFEPMTTCSIDYAAREAGDYFAGDEITPEPIVVTFTCSLELAQQLLAIARASCPDVATGIRAAIDRQTH
jgi:hypothetical protein